MSRADESLEAIRTSRAEIAESVRGPIVLPAPGLNLELEVRTGSTERKRKHIEQMCFAHLANFAVAAQVKSVYIADVFLDSADSHNPLGVAMAARSALELNAFLHEVLVRLLEAKELAAKNWLDGGQKFFGIVIRARLGSSNPDQVSMMRGWGVSKKATETFHIANCLTNLAHDSKYSDVQRRYDELCDYVHHNFSSSTTVSADAGPGTSAGWTDGALIIFAKEGTRAQYSYPLPKGSWPAMEQISEGFLADFEAAQHWITSLPASPFLTPTFAARQADIDRFLRSEVQGIAGDKASTRKVGRNEPCPCGSGKKYKNCCLNRTA